MATTKLSQHASSRAQRLWSKPETHRRRGSRHKQTFERAQHGAAASEERRAEHLCEVCGAELKKGCWMGAGSVQAYSQGRELVGASEGKEGKRGSAPVLS